MRSVLYSVLSVALLFVTLASANAQSTFYPGGTGYYPGGTWFTGYQPLSDTGSLSRKWSLTRYGSITASSVFFKGGAAGILSAPVGLQLNRRLNDNLYAFTRVSVAPAYISFHVPFRATDFYKYSAGNNGYNTGNGGNFNNFGMYGRAELGLMYINDQKTFSISGSLGIERSSYPFYPFDRFPHQPAF